MALPPKYLALSATRSGLPWSTGVVHTQKCRQCSDTNKSMFRRCDDCGLVQCAKCFNRGGWRHVCNQEHNYGGPFPTWEQERQVLSIFGGKIPLRDGGARPEREPHNGSWSWDPTPEALAVAPGAHMVDGMMLIFHSGSACRAIITPQSTTAVPIARHNRTSTSNDDTSASGRMHWSAIDRDSGRTRFDTSPTIREIPTSPILEQSQEEPTLLPSSLGILNFARPRNSKTAVRTRNAVPETIERINKPPMIPALTSATTKQSEVVVLKIPLTSCISRKQVIQDLPTDATNNKAMKTSNIDRDKHNIAAVEIETSSVELCRSTRHQPRIPPHCHTLLEVQAEDYNGMDTSPVEQNDGRKRKQSNDQPKSNKRFASQIVVVDHSVSEASNENAGLREPRTRLDTYDTVAGMQQLKEWKTESETNSATSKPLPTYQIGVGSSTQNTLLRCANLSRQVSIDQSTSQRRSIKLDVSSIQMLNVSLAPGMTYLATTTDANDSTFYLAGSYGRTTVDTADAVLFVLEPAGSVSENSSNVHFNVSNTEHLNLTVASGVKYTPTMTNPLSSSISLVGLFTGSPAELVATDVLFVLETSNNLDAFSNIPPIALPHTRPDQHDRGYARAGASMGKEVYFGRVLDSDEGDTLDEGQTDEAEM